MQDDFSITQGHCLVIAAQDVCRRDIPPRCIRRSAPENANTLWKELRGPVFCLLLGHIIIECLYGGVRKNSEEASLSGELDSKHSLTYRFGPAQDDLETMKWDCDIQLLELILGSEFKKLTCKSQRR